MTPFRFLLRAFVDVALIGQGAVAVATDTGIPQWFTLLVVAVAIFFLSRFVTSVQKLQDSVAHLAGRLVRIETQLGIIERRDEQQS